MSSDRTDSSTGDLRARLRRLERAIARRRTQVERLSAQVEVLEDEVRSPLERAVEDADDPELVPGVPSYSFAARLHRRSHIEDVNRRAGLREPVSDLAPKLDGQRWAALNGVDGPRILGRWADPDAVEWDALPERFVLKSNVGAGASNVYPLSRGPGSDEYTDLLTGEPTTRDAVTERLWARHGEQSLYFVEEFLVGPDGDADTVPADVKVFCFYGEPAYLETRRGDQSRAAAVPSRARSFLPDGTELVGVRPLVGAGSDDVGQPRHLGQVVAAAARLSSTIRRPHVRLDFFETEDRVVFGEVTMSPGHVPMLLRQWDRRLGEVYEEAYARLLADLAAEGALHVDTGAPRDLPGGSTP